MHKKQSGLSFETAETIAIQALGFLSSDSELLGRFLALSGLDPSAIRDVASEPSFLAAVLDFLLSDDSLISDLFQQQRHCPRRRGDRPSFA